MVTNHSSLDMVQYLSRIGCQMEEQPNLNYLRRLHQGHLYHVPFENLDIHLNRKIILDIAKIYEKIVIKKRGGLCFELNGLFHQLLTRLGFRCHLLSAQNILSNETLSVAFDHMCILVSIEKKDYLIDIGHENLFFAPKLIQSGQVQIDYNKYYKIKRNINKEYMLVVSTDAIAYKPLYIFTKKAHQLIEFIDRNDFHQTNPASRYKRRIIVTQAKPNGRITLTNALLTIEKLGVLDQQKILNQADFKSKLEQHFGIWY